jgi:hypothetical protein
VGVSEGAAVLTSAGAEQPPTTSAAETKTKPALSIPTAQY